MWIIRLVEWFQWEDYVGRGTVCEIEEFGRCGYVRGDGDIGLLCFSDGEEFRGEGVGMIGCAGCVGEMGFGRHGGQACGSTLDQLKY